MNLLIIGVILALTGVAMCLARRASIKGLDVATQFRIAEDSADDTEEFYFSTALVSALATALPASSMSMPPEVMMKAQDIPRPDLGVSHCDADGQSEETHSASYRDQALGHFIESWLAGDTPPHILSHGLSAAQFHSLYRHIIKEGYGE